MSSSRICPIITEKTAIYRSSPLELIRTSEILYVTIRKRTIPLILNIVAYPFSGRDGNWSINARLEFDSTDTRQIASITIRYLKNKYLLIAYFRNKATKPDNEENSEFTSAEILGFRGIGRRMFYMLLRVLILQWPFLLEQGKKTIIALFPASLTEEGNDEKLVSYYTQLGFTQNNNPEIEGGDGMVATIDHIVSICEQTKAS